MLLAWYGQVTLEAMIPPGKFTVLAVDGLIIHAQLATATFAVCSRTRHNQPCCFHGPSPIIIEPAHANGVAAVGAAHCRKVVE